MGKIIEAIEDARREGVVTERVDALAWVRQRYGDWISVIGGKRVAERDE